MEREGFSLMEVAAVLMVMAVASALALMSSRIANQTSKREAERVAGYIHRIMQKAERTRKNFYLEIYSNFIRVNWYNIHTIDDSFRSSVNCNYSDNFPKSQAAYNAYKKRFINGGTITIKDADGKIWYVIIAGITEGRVRTSDIPPP